MSEENKKILLNKSRNKQSVNADVKLDIGINSSEKKLPADKVGETIDQYKQYIKEKDGSNKYRLVFTINPICSNVLFNRITEIVKDEGSSGCTYYSEKNGQIGSATEYTHYTKIKDWNSKSKLTRSSLIRDTALSHPGLAKPDGLVYHCGYDIFNNHYFRNLEEVLINKLSADEATIDTGKTKFFNELGDYARDYDGSIIKTFYGSAVNGSNSHLFFKDTTRHFLESISNGLTERNGWFGFFNPTKIDIRNLYYSYKENKSQKKAVVTINKCLNNNKACEFIDMYPDRSLYSFLPKNNKYRQRNEYNWDYCITYPYKNYFNNELVTFIDGSDVTDINGLRAEFVDEFGRIINDISLLINDKESDGRSIEKKEYRNFTIRTHVKNNIINGDKVIIHLIGKRNTGGSATYSVKTPINVISNGLNGYGGNYYLSISSNDIMNGLLRLDTLNGLRPFDDIYCYIQRVEEGRPCKYYFRVFKRLPNFKNSPINNINPITQGNINEYCLKDFASSLNKLGFSENIYGDRIAQVVFDDDIDTTNIFDNLGRPISELFLTIVKTNRGNTIWYKSKNGTFTIDKNKNYFTDESIEYSHCFSEVTSGIDMPWKRKVSDKKIEQYQYNVHGLHNVVNDSGDATFDPTVDMYPLSCEALENSITISGTTINKEGSSSNGEFLGDICELSENTLTETVLDSVCHRFNTVQRETTKLYDEFGGLLYDEITRDDYDGNFTITNYKFREKRYLDNIAPEGYFYNPHYKVQVREYDDTVYEGYDTKVTFDKLVISNASNGTLSGRTDRNYYFEKGDTIVGYNKRENKKYNGVILNIPDETDEYRDIEFILSNIGSSINVDDFIFFKPNILKPSNAYEFNDGTGKYVWRVLKSAINISSNSELYDSVFTNGCHYYHKNINFFLKRQDPFGDFWLNSLQNPNVPSGYKNLDILGNEQEITTIDYFKEGETDLC